MELRDARSPEDIQRIYGERGLASDEDKARWLRDAMRIRASRCDGEETAAEEVRDLEDLALTHLWEVLVDDRQGGACW